MFPQVAMFFEKQWKAESQNGESLHFEFCKGGYFSKKEEYGLKVVGKTFQDGTPSPDNPISIQSVKAGTKVKVCGKNLCPRLTSNISKGLEFNVNADGSVTLNGATSSGLGYSNDVSAILGAGTYTKTSHINNTTLIAQYYDENGNVKYLGNTFTLTEEKEIVFRLQTQAGAVFDNYVFYPQVEIGSVKTEYEPYLVPQEIITPCDLYEGDTWYFTSGKVEKYNEIIILDENINHLEITSNKWFNYYVGFSHKQNTSKCSHYKRVNAYSTEAANTVNHFQDNINSNILYFKLEQTTVEDVKNYWKSQKEKGTPVTVVYELETPKIEQYNPQPIFALQGTVNVLQEPIELSADLSATMLIKR